MTLSAGRVRSITEKIRAAASASANEAELRSKLTRLIEDVAEELGISLASHEEYTLATGSAIPDTVRGATLRRSQCSPCYVVQDRLS